MNGAVPSAFSQLSAGGGRPSVMMCASRKAKVRALVAACLVVCAALVFFYHYSNDAGELSELHRKRLYGDQRRREDSVNFVDDKAQSSPKSSFTWPWAKRDTLTAAGDCRALKVRRDVDFHTPDVYPTLNFKPQSRSYWNQTFENRYYETRKQWAKLPLEFSLRQDQIIAGGGFPATRTLSLSKGGCSCLLSAIGMRALRVPLTPCRTEPFGGTRT
ncbi:hypothetical protein HPB49_022605 [Dermacentor silvarum]|uniref:Uncharacterized protein n=1 Tax=Dermacentor silvarum TaxID=543639 RepID=A0ACB8D811_DERSI|nr:hypothetical protein HPB49_022605 [Dermacentor silvarum]